MFLFSYRKKIVNYSQEIIIIFLSQICFSFSFMGFKSLFVLYALHHLNFSQKTSVELFAILMTLSYASSILGGYLSDKFLQPRWCQLIGSLLCLISMIVFIFSFHNSLYLAMALFSIGSGCIKPNISALLSSLFTKDQNTLKEKAFIHLYISMNIGNILGPVISSLTAQHYGWNAGLMVIVISFILGIVCLIWGAKSVYFLKEKIETRKLVQAGFLIVFGLMNIFFLLQSLISKSTLMAMIMSISLVIFGLIYYQSTPLERQGLHKVLGYILCFACFCSLFEQAGGTLMLFIDKAVDRQVGSYLLPSASLLSFNPFCVLLLAPFLPTVTRYLFEMKGSLKGSSKMGLGFFLVTLSFGVLSFATFQAHSLIPLPYILLAFLFQTLGELYIVPLTLSNITQHAPSRQIGIMLSFWLMAIGYGHYGASIMAQFFHNIGSIATAPLDFFNFFSKVTLISGLIVLGFILVFVYHTFNKKNNDLEQSR